MFFILLDITESKGPKTCLYQRNYPEEDTNRKSMPVRHNLASAQQCMGVLVFDRFQNAKTTRKPYKAAAFIYNIATCFMDCGNY